MTVDYEDGRVSCDDRGVTIRGYYFPWGSKRIRYGDIREVDRRQMGALTGKGRIWGTGDFRHWLNLDPGRPRKDVALVLDVGRRVIPVITPDDPDTVEALLRQRMSGQTQPPA